MKKALLLVLILPLSESISQSWQMISPQPTADYMSSVSFIDSQKAWVTAGGSGVVWQTTNGGSSWVSIETPMRAFYSDVHFLNESHGWVVGGYGRADGADTSYAYSTMNGGISWERHYPDSSLNGYNKIHFVTNDSGFILSKTTVVYQTTDGGGTWNKKRVAFATGLKDMHFLNSRTGFVIGDSTYRTTDGGENWRGVFGGGITLFFLDTARGFRSDGAFLLRTQNGGTSWDTVLVEQVSSLSMLGEKEGWAFGPNGVYSSADSGKSWQRVHPYNVTVGKARLQDGGWAVGEFGHIYRWSSSGEWTEKSKRFSGGSFFDVFAMDEKRFWIVGGSVLVGGEAHFTADSGKTWTSVILDYPWILRSIWFEDDLNGWIVGQRAILRTTDGGTNWIPYTGLVCCNLIDVHFVDQTSGFAVGGNSILRTTDGGINWIASSPLSEVDFSSVFFVNKDTGWVVGTGSVNPARGVILISTDGGLSWNTQLDDLEGNLSKAFFLDPLTGWAVGGRTMSTTNGGTSWVAKTSPGNFIWDVFFDDYLHGYLSGSDGLLYYTEDGLQSYEIYNAPTSSDLRDIAKIGSTSLLIVGGFSALGFDRLVTSIESPNYHGLPELPALQNFPNPFNSTTRIFFQNPRTANVRLSIFDFLGREIRRFTVRGTNGFQYIEWDGKDNHGIDVASGVYLIRLKYGIYDLISKAILIR